MDYRFLLSLAIILLSTKVFGLISQRVQLPSVMGALLAGLLLGPTCLNMVVETDFLLKTSELGVIFLMFLAGLDTDLKELKKNRAHFPVHRRLRRSGAPHRRRSVL